MGMVILFLWMTLSGASAYGVEKGLLKALGLQELNGNREAPEITLSTPDGGKMNLQDYRGKVIILHFWATWCGPCKEEFPLLEKMYQRFKGQDVAFLPIAIDTGGTQAKIDAFARGLGASFPVYLARSGNVPGQYWTWGVPVTYFIDKKGLITGRAIGPRDWASDKVDGLLNVLLEEK